METQLAEKYSETLELYLKTLIRFVARDNDFFENNPQYHAQKMDLFDTDVHFNTPMIKTVVKIKKYKEKDESGSKYYLYTKPPLISICKDLFNITNLFLNALSGIKRIDESIFPQLTLKKNILRSPDQKVDPKLVLIAACINYAKEKPQEQLKKMKKYIQFLDISTESMILSMKKRSYEKYTSSNGGSDEEKDSSSDAEEENSDEVISEDDEDAYKNIDITNEVYIDEFKVLRGAYWDVQRYVDKIYDFGLMQMDCTSFLKNIIKHLDKLLTHLTQYLRNDFLARSNHIFIQYKSIQMKVSEEVNSIDEVIYLIEFIDNIKKPEQKLEELYGKLDQCKIRKDFIDDLYIPLEEEDFQKYLNLLTYPKNLLKFLDNRRNELESERSRLSKMMDLDIKEISIIITRLKKELEEFKTVGMYFTNKKELIELNQKLSEGGLDIQGVSRDQMSKLAPGAGSSYKSGSKKSGEGRKKTEVYGDFDSIHVEEYAERMDHLKQEIDE